MATWASPAFDWSTKSYGDKEFNMDAALTSAADRASTMNDPTNFRKRRVAMMNEYEVPLMQAQFEQKKGLQEVVNKPAMARLDWDRAPEHQTQLMERIGAERAPSMMNAETQKAYHEYLQGQTAQDRAIDLRRAAPPSWTAETNEAGGAQFYDKSGIQHPGFYPSPTYKPPPGELPAGLGGLKRPIAGPGGGIPEELPSTSMDNAPFVPGMNVVRKPIPQYAAPSASAPMFQNRLAEIRKKYNLPGLNTGGEWWDRFVNRMTSRRSAALSE